MLSRDRFKIRSIEKLQRAIARLPDKADHVIERQVKSVQSRLSSGIETDGTPFSPYKQPEYYDQPRPLMKAARLFEGASVSTTSAGDLTEIRATIYGLPARIAYYQNKARQFLGYSDSDRKESVSGVVEAIKKAGEDWP